MTQFGARLRALGGWRVQTLDQTQAAPGSATSLTPAEMRTGQRLMTREGSLWSVMNSLAAPGGLITTGFALLLKADAFAIGLLSALPLLAALLQLWTPQLVALTGGRKQLCVLTLGFARLLMLPLALLGIVNWLMPESRTLWLALFLAIITLSAAFTSIGGTSWLSWASTVVPANKRAVYFSRRSTIIGIIGLVSTLLAGFVLDNWKRVSPEGSETNPAVYGVLFFLAAVFGIATIFVLQKTPDLGIPKNATRPPFFESLAATWNHLPLRNFLVFRSVWLFAVGLVIPYYTVYMLRDLNLSFTEISILTNVGAGAGLVTLPWWGRIIEKAGCTRVVFWTSAFKAIYVIFWAFIVPGQPFLPLVLLHLTLCADAGLNLGSGNLLMNLMPSQNSKNVGFFSTFTAVTSLVSAAGPFLAGMLIGMLAGGGVQFSGMSFGAIQLMFLLSGVLRLASLLFFRGFEDPAT